VSGSAGPVRGALQRLLRLPGDPQAPAGDPGSLRVFRASPRYLQLSRLRWLVKQVGTVLGLLAGLAFLEQLPFLGRLPFGAGRLVWIAEVVGIGAFLFQLPVTWMLVRLDYDFRWYIVTDRSLRVREGVVTIREQTMTFSNVQNLAVRQGPLQRLFGISDLEVRSAGGGDHGADADEQKRSLHLAYFRGIEDAASIRDAVRERLQSVRDSGLGDPDDEPAAVGAPGAAGPPADLLAAARELAAAARALRDEAVRGGSPSS
jgi:membrane protein YdbS with pleckstrin-like domain